MQWKKIILFFVVLIFVVVILPHSLFAQTVPTDTPGPSPTPCITTAPDGQRTNCIMVSERELGFRIPNFTDILTFAIRAVFVFGGLAALFFLLLGALAWITSGGEKDKVAAAQQKIQAAVIGVIMIAIVLAIVVTLEQIIFGGKICLGISCPITIPTLLKAPNSAAPNQVLPPEDGGVEPTATQTPEQLSATPAPTTDPSLVPQGTENDNSSEDNRVYSLPASGPVATQTP